MRTREQDALKSKNYYNIHKEEILAKARAAYKIKAGQRRPYSQRSTNRGQSEIPRVRTLRRFYGLTLEQFQDMLSIQDGKCGLCGVCFSDNLRPVVDHNHMCCKGPKSCGKCLRGLLCSGCNLGIGHFRDSPERLGLAINYLRRYKSTVISRP